MKTKLRVLLSAVTLIAGLALLLATAIPLRLAAQDKHGHNPLHHHYKLIDMGTFGGPASFIGTPNNVNPELSGQGTTGGASATSVSLTSTNNPFVNGGLDGLVPKVFHAFAWQDGAVLDLGALPPVHEHGSDAEAVSENGDIVVGGSENGVIDPILGFDELRAVRWQNGYIRDLGTLGGATALANSLNEQGQVAGFASNSVPDPFSIYYLLFGSSSNGTQTRAFLWDEKNGMQDLGTLGTGNDAFAVFINARGQVAGFSYINTTPNVTTGLPTLDPFLWDKENGMQDLGTLGGTIGEPTALNNRGEVIGVSNLSGDQSSDPFLWEHRNLLDLYTSTSGGNPLTADAINDAGEIVGQAAFLNGSSDAYLWENGVATDLGHLEGDCGSRAWAINSKSQIAGISLPCIGIEGHAFLWENGSMVDLNSLIPPRSSLTLLLPVAINDRGEIAGIGLPPGCTHTDNGGECGHAFLIIPCDENHPGLEGCDYSMVEVPAAVTQHLSTTTPVSPALTGRGMLHRYRLRRFPGLRALDSGTDR